RISENLGETAKAREFRAKAEEAARGGTPAVRPRVATAPPEASEAPAPSAAPARPRVVEAPDKKDSRPAARGKAQDSLALPPVDIARFGAMSDKDTDTMMEAIQAGRKKDFARQIALLEPLAAKYPADPMIPFALGLGYRGLGKWAEA